MRADVAPWLVTALFATAGLGMLHSFRVIERSRRNILASLGLAYLAGVAAVCSLLTVALVLGIPFTLATFVVIGLAVSTIGVGIGEYRLRRSAGPGARRTAPVGAPRPPLAIDRAALMAFIVVFGLYAIVGLRDASPLPLDQWDGWSIWTRKAVILTHFDSLQLGFFASQSYAFMHQDYPLLLPLFEAVHFRAMGEIDTQAIHAHFWVLLIAFVWAMAFLASRVTRPVVWAPVLLLVAVAPAVTNQLLSAYADVPAAMFVAAGVLAAGIWFAHRDGGYLALAVLLLAGAAGTKNEGLMAAAATLAVIAILLVANRDRLATRPFVAGAAVFVAAVLPWRIWLAAHDISGDISLSDGLNPGFLLDHGSRLWPAVKTLYAHAADQSAWLYLLPFGLVAVAVTLVTARKGIALFYLATGSLLFTLMVWAYLVRPGDLTWLLNTSANRVVTLVVFLAIPATLQLAAELDDRLAPAAQRSPPETDPRVDEPAPADD